ncbi:hypothetical protein [Rhodococcus tukisamuensis]|uniref:Uncharacterized protein n=1 Tax=Rhodococcus tukisamuensis TaxID=168276 RepID=A0A1G7EWZ5_9NOCA|nr:hypothetical protein [Rhodococcus tukisamuensis]SDE68213.1 hypothetical protein SAMN05444580_1296 [Rhodococcus tukisamuensis]
MSITTHRAARIAATAAVAATALLGAAGTAAADEWPTPPPYPSPIVPYDTKAFLMPTDLDYWNPFVSADRLTSPFGTSTRIVCQGFHGVTTDCWQADQNGNPHKLVKLAYDFPGSTGSNLPGGGPGHFVYPGFIPGIG